MADNEDQDDTQGSGSQTYSTPHDQVQLPPWFSLQLELAVRWMYSQS